jgi:type II secretory pathway pseudopilin PulG
MKKVFSKISIVDFVVVVAILLILAAIIAPSFVPPTGTAAVPHKVHQVAPARAAR